MAGMNDYISPSRRLAEVKLTRGQNPNVVFLFLEGPDDIKFFSRLFREDVKVSFCNGKTSVLKLMEAAGGSRINNILAIVDRDYDFLLGKNLDIKGLYYTDATDMETTILMEKKAVKKMFFEYGDMDRINNYKSTHGKDLADKVFEICSIVGVMRYASHKYDMGLKFKNVRISRFIDDNLEMNLDGYIREIIKNSNKEKNAESVKRRLKAELEIEYNYWEVCRGHDLVNVFRYVLCDEGLCFGDVCFQEKELSRFLRGTYEESWFEKTNLHRDISSWETKKEIKVLETD